MFFIVIQFAGAHVKLYQGSKTTRAQTAEFNAYSTLIRLEIYGFVEVQNELCHESDGLD